MSDKIKVAVKVRPLIPRELDKKLLSHWQIKNDTIFLQDPTGKQKSEPYVFDHIFSPTSTNNDIFDTIVKPIIDAAIEGFNGTVFAYGQTSSGKTYTMTGRKENPGIIPLTIHYMFHAINQCPGREFLLRVSYMEIYNEKVNDLISLTENLPVREDSTGQVFVAVNEKVCNSPDIVLEYMNKGEKNRRFGETDVNERSSRSHTILRIILESRTSDEEDGAVKVSHLNLVDLAGSERAGQSGATGDRFKEGCHINSSLTTLGLVIKQLSEGCLDGRQFISFRDSKLTRLLQSSLGGNAMTAIICTVTPAMIDQTMDTLNFASRAKKIKNKPQLNEVLSDAALIKRYRKQIAKLYEELENTKLKCVPSEVQEIENKLQQQEKLNQTLSMRINRLKQALINTSVDLNMHGEMKKKKYSNRRKTWGGPAEVHRRSLAYTSTLDAICESPGKIHHSFSTTNLVTDIRTPMEEFEIDLMTQEENDSIKDSWKNETNQSSVLEGNESSFFCTENTTAETPPKVLRERIKRVSSHFDELQSEYDELKKFARLEKQIYHTDGRQFEKENQELTEKLNQLTQTVETLEVEKCELENNIAQKDIKLSSLEMQVLNFEVTSEILRKNFSEREAELKKSLEEAWATLELKDASISQLTENMSALQQGMKISADEDGKTNKMLSVQTSLIDDLQDRIEQLNNEKIKYKLLLEEKNAEIMQIQKEHVEVCKHFNNKIKELETSLLKQISMHKIQYSDDDDNVMESDTIKKLQAEITELKCDDYKLKMVLSGLVLNQEETDDHDCKKEIIEDLDLSACNKEFSDIQLKIENLIDNLICTEYRGNEELCQEVELMSCVEATGLMQQIENLVDNLLSTETDYSQEETVYTQVRSIDLRQKQLTELQTDMEMKDKETTDLLNQLEDLLVNTEDLQKHNEKLTQQLTGKKLNSEKHQMCNDVTSEYHKSQKLLAVSEVCHFQENNGHLGLQSSVSVVTHREDASSLQELRANLNEKLVLLETKIQEADDLRKCNEELRNQLANMETHLPEDIVKQREEFMQTLALLKRVSLEKEHLEKQYQKLEEKLSLLESKSEELKESQKHNEELVKQSAVMVFRIQDLEQYIQKLMEQVDIKESRIQRLKKCNKELSEQLDTMEGKIQELEECQKQNKELLKQSAFMVVKIQDLEQYAKKLLEDVDSKDSRIQSLKKCNEVITHELDTVEAKVQGLEEYQKQNEELLKQSAFMIVKIQDLEQYVEKLIGWVDSKESRIQTLMESNKAMSKQVGTMEGMFHELKEFRKQNEELLKQLAYMVVKIQDLEQYTENLFGQLDNKESTIQNLRKCNEMMSEQLDMMEDRFQYLEVYQKQNEELVKQLAFMTLSVQDLEQYTEKLMADVESRDSKVQSLEKCNEMMSQQFDVMEGRFQDLDECQKQNEELLKQSAFMVVKIQNLERYNKELMEWVNSKESGIQSLKKSNEVLSEQLETMKTNFQELEECRKQNEELVKQSAFMVVKIQDLEQYAEKLIGCVDSNELKIQRIKKSNEVMSEQLDMMEGRCQDMGEYQKQNEELVRQLGFMVVKIQDLEQYTEKLMCNVDSKNLRIQSLKKCNEMMSEQLETVETKFQELEEYREQNEELLKQLAFMVIKIQDLQNYNAKIKEQAHENDSKLYYLHRHNQIETETEEAIRNHPFGIQPEETVSLQEINSHLIEEQETKTQDIISLQNLNKELTNNVDKKTQELIVTEKQCHKLTEQLSEFDIQKKKEVGTLKEEIIILQTEKNLLEKKLKEAVKERNDMETQINELNYIVMVQKQNHSLTDKLMNVDAKQEEINTLQKETVKLRRELKLLKTAMGDLVCDLKLRLMILDESLNFVQYTADICAEDKQILKDIFDQEQLKSMSDIKTLLLKLKAENNILQDKLNGPQIPTETEITENVTITNTITPEMSNEDICTEMKDMEITVCDMTIPPVNDATCYYNATIIEETLQSFCINNTMQILDNDQTVREYEQILNEKLKAFDELEKKFHSLNTEHDNLRRINYELTEKLKVFENMCIEVYELRKQNLSLEEKTKDVERFKEEVNCLRTENNQFVEKLNYLKDVQLNLDELNTKFNNLQNLNDELTEKLKMYDCIKYEMSQLAVINASLEEKLQKCKQMEDDFNALKVEYEKQLSVNIDLNDKLNSMEAMKNEYVSVKAHIKDLEEEFKEAESLKNDMNSIRSENEELLNINNELNEKLNTLQNENSDLKQLYTDLEENIKDFENTKNELISAKDEHEKLLNKLADLEEKLKENENFKNDLILVKSENEKLVKMNNDLDEKLITLEEVQCQYMEFQTTNIDLKEKLELLKNEVIQLKNDNEKLINVNCDLSKKITGIEEVQKACTKLCADLEEKVKEIEIMKSDKISIEAEKEQLFMVNNELNEKLTTLRVVQEQYIGLKRQFAELEESIKDFEILKNGVTSFKSENEELMNANRELKEKIVSLESIECEYFELKTLNADFEERIKYTEILKSEVLSMKSENEKLLITNSNISEKLDMLEAVHTKYIDLCADVEEKIKEIEVLKTNKALTEAENEKLLNLNSELTAKLAILELIHNECSELKVVNSDLQERVKEIEVLKYEVASVKIENQTLLKANIDLNEKLTILEPVKNKYIDLRAEIQEKIEEIDTLKSAKESTDIEIEKLLNLNSDLNEKLSILEQVQSECTELKVLNSDLEERVKEIAVLKCEMASVKTENEKLSNANSDLSEKVIILEQIQNKYDALCADVEEKIKEIEVLKINKVSVEAENKKLLNVNNELNEKLTTFENIQSECAELKAINCDLQERVEEIEKLKTHINSVQNENENLSAEINQVKKVEHELYNLRAENSDLQKANADLTEYVKEVDRLQKRVNELCAENDCLNEKVLIIAKLQQQVSEASSEYDRLTIINDDLNEKLNNFESKINSLQVENEQKNNDLENANNCIKFMETENSTLSGKLQTISSELHVLMSDNEKMKDEIRIFKSQNNELKMKINELETYENENNNLMEKLESLQSEVNELSSQNNDLTEKLKYLTDLENTVAGLKVENEQLSESVSLMKNVKDELNTLHAKYNDQLAQNDQLIEKLKSLESENTEFSSLNSGLEEKLKFLECEISSLRGENGQNLEKLLLLKRVEQDFNNLNSHYNDVLVQNNELAEKLKSLENKIGELSSQNADLQEMLKDFKNFENEILAVRTLNDELTGQISTMKNIEQDFCNLNVQFNETLTQNNELSEKLKAMENDIYNIRYENTQLKEDLRSAKQLELVVEDLTRQNSTLNSEVSEKVKHMEEFQNEVSNLKKLNEELTKHMNDANTSEAVKSLHTQNQDLIKKSEESNNLQTINNDFKAYLTLHTENDAELNISKNANSELEEKITTLLNENKSLFESLEDSRLLKKTMIKEICSLSPGKTHRELVGYQLTNLYMELMSVFLGKEREVITSIQKEYDNKMFVANNKIEELQNMENKQKKWIEEVEKENDHLTKELAQTKDEKDVLNKQLTEKSNEFVIKCGEMTVIQTKLTQAQSDAATIQLELDYLKQKYKINMSDVSFSDKIEELGEQLSRKEKLVERIREELNAVTVQKRKFQKMNEEATVKCTDLIAATEGLKTKLAEMEELNKKLTDDLQCKSKEVSKLCFEMEQKKLECDQHLLKIDEIKLNATNIINCEYKVLQEKLYVKDNHSLSQKLKEIVSSVQLLKTTLELLLEKCSDSEMEHYNRINVLENGISEKTDEINKLTQEIKNLHKQFELEKSSFLDKISELEQCLKQKDHDIDSTDSEKLTLNNKLKELEQQIILKESEVDKLSSENLLLQNRISDIHNQLSSKLVEIKTLQELVNSKSNEYLTVCNQLNEKQKYIDEINKEKRQLLNKCDLLTTQSSEEMQVVEKLKCEKEKANNEIRVLKENDDKKQKALEDLDKLIKLEKQENAKLKVKQETLLRQLESVEKKLLLTEKNLSENRDLKSKISILEDAKSKLQHEYDDMYKIFKASEREKNVLLQKEQEQITKLKFEIRENKLQIDQLLKLNNEICLENETLQKQLSCLKNSKDKEIEVLQIIIKQEKHGNTKLKLEHDLLTNQLEKFKKKLSLGTNKMDSDTDNHFRTLQEKNEELRAKILELEETKIILGNKCEEMSKIIEANENESAGVFRRQQELVTKLKSEINELKINTEAQLKHNKELTAENESLKIQVLSLNNREPQGSMDTEIVKIKKENEDLKSKIAELEEAKGYLDEECEEMYKMIQANEKEMTSVLKREAEQVKKLKSEIQKLEEENEAQLKHNKELINENESLKTLLSNLKKTTNRDTQDNIDTDVAKLKKENNDLKSKIAELEEAKGFLNEECEEMYKMIQANEKEMTSILKREEEQVTKLKYEIDKLKEENEGQLKHNKELTNENESLKTQLSVVKNTKYKDAQGNVDSEISKLQEENKDLKSKITELEEAKGYLDEECEEMYKMIQANEKEMCTVLQREQEQVTKLKSEVEQLKVKLEELQSVNESLKKRLSSFSDDKNKELEDLQYSTKIDKQDNRKLKLKQESLLRQIEELGYKNECLEKKLSVLETSSKSVTGECDKCDKLHKLIQANEKKTNSILSQDHEQMSKLKNEIEENKLKTEELAKLNKEVQNQNDVLKLELSRCENFVRELRSEKRQLLNQLTESKAKAKCFETQLNGLLKEKENLAKVDNILDTDTGSQKQLNSTTGCQCEQLRKQVTQLKLNLADGNAKITGLELQIQNDYKKRVQDLEKSLDQAKHKINDLKTQVRRFQNQMNDVTVRECEVCHRRKNSRLQVATQTDQDSSMSVCSVATASSSSASGVTRRSGIVENASIQTLQGKLKDANTTIDYLKKLCRMRNAKIQELDALNKSRNSSPRSVLTSVSDSHGNITTTPKQN